MSGRVEPQFTMNRVPELSLKNYSSGNAETKHQFVDDLFNGLKYFGFVILKDHPIDLDLLQHAYHCSERFFALDEATKKSYISKSGAGQRGYTPFGREHAKDSKFPDLKEFWHVGRELPKDHKFAAIYPQNVWPDLDIADFRPTFTRLYDALDGVGRLILRALTGPLEVEVDYFDKMVSSGNSVLRLLHYPPVPEGTDPGCVRAAAHEDINLITILVSASASGLELKDRNGDWLPIETQGNNLIVDSGDMLARITNEVIPSTTHRVVNPEGPNTSRYSMPFFIHPNHDAMLSCIPSCRGAGAKWPEILADDFLTQRLREIGLI